MKQSAHVKNWRRRWIVLTSKHLASYKSPTAVSCPTESLLLAECTTVKSAEDELHSDNIFRVDTSKRTFLMIAGSTAEKEAWIGAIGRQMVPVSSKQKFCEDDIVY